MSPDSKCSRCGGAVAAGAKFCRHCGSAVEATDVDFGTPGRTVPVGKEPPSCPSCNQPVASDASFCRSCGGRLRGAAAGPEPVARVAPPVSPGPSPEAQARPTRVSRAEAPAGRLVESSARGPLFAVGAIGACLALAGLVGGGAYLLTRGDSGTDESIPAFSGEFGAPFEGSPAEGEAFAESSDGDRSSELQPTERGFPTDSEPVVRAEAEDLLRSFHVALVERDFRYAWSLLSSRKRQQERQEKSYSGWKDAQATLTPYLFANGIDVQVDGLEDDGVARVSVTGMGWSQPGSPCSEWSGLTWVRYEGGSWYYDPGYSTTAERRRRWQDRSDELLGVGC